MEEGLEGDRRRHPGEEGTESSTGTVLSQWMRMGPGRSGLNAALDAMPDKESKIIANRLREHRANMERTLNGIKTLAEQPAATP